MTTELVEAMALELLNALTDRIEAGPDAIFLPRDKAISCVAAALDQAHRAGELAMRERAVAYMLTRRHAGANACATAISALEPEGMGEK